MPVVEVRVSGIDELNRRMNHISSRLPSVMAGAVEQSTGMIHERLAGYTQDYPPKPEGSTYERTFRLQESVEEEVNESSGRVFSNLEYAPAVMGAASQIPLHQGRWWTQQDVANEMFPEVEALSVAAVNKLVRESVE